MIAAPTSAAVPPIVKRTNSLPVVQEMLERFMKWLEANGFKSYDQYDFWSTWYGRFAKRTYYRTHVLGAPLVGPIFVADLLFPSVRSLFVPKRRFPIADAHLVMGFVNLFTITRKEQYLQQAKVLAKELLDSSIPGFSGRCWGYPFDWETSAGLYGQKTPLITTTPYCFEAFLSLYDCTGEQAYLDVAASAATFASKDLKDTPVTDRSAACSYSPGDHSKVLNANAYRAFMLVESSHRFGNAEYREQALRNLAFILDQQREDGAWLYEAGSSHNAFIDNFHTCFVLKNLVKANRHLDDKQIDNAVRKGYDFYRTQLFTEQGTPRPFAQVSRVQPVNLETYDLAEGVSLGVLLRDLIPGAFEFSLGLSTKLLRSMQLSDGHFTTRVNIGGLRNKVAYLRWPQAQVFFALTRIFTSLQ